MLTRIKLALANKELKVLRERYVNNFLLLKRDATKSLATLTPKLKLDFQDRLEEQIKDAYEALEIENIYAALLARYNHSPDVLLQLSQDYLAYLRAFYKKQEIAKAQIAEWNYQAVNQESPGLIQTSNSYMDKYAQALKGLDAIMNEIKNKLNSQLTK